MTLTSLLSRFPQLAENYGMEFFESSASNNSNVIEVGSSSATALSEFFVGTETRVSICRGATHYTHILPLSSQSFTRVAELVLQAHKRDVESLLGSLDDYLDQVDLEGKKGLDGNDNVQKTCAC